MSYPRYGFMTPYRGHHLFLSQQQNFSLCAPPFNRAYSYSKRNSTKVSILPVKNLHPLTPPTGKYIQWQLYKYIMSYKNFQ